MLTRFVFRPENPKVSLVGAELFHAVRAGISSSLASVALFHVLKFSSTASET